MRQPWWEWGMWFYRAVITQTNGAGGAIVMDIAPTGGNMMLVMHAKGVNSGTNSLQILRNDEDNNESIRMATVASGAGSVITIPRDSLGVSTDSGHAISAPMETRFFRASDRFVILQGGAGAQNDTLTIDIRAFLSSADRPVVTKGRSTNAGDVTIATPTVDSIR